MCAFCAGWAASFGSMPMKKFCGNVLHVTVPVLCSKPGPAGAICRVAAGTTTTLSDGDGLSHQHLKQQHRGSDGRDYRATLALIRCNCPGFPKYLAPPSYLGVSLSYEDRERVS